MNVKRLALALVVVVSLLAVSTGTVSGAVSTATDGGDGPDICTLPHADSPDDARSGVGTDCTGGGGCVVYCLP